MRCLSGCSVVRGDRFFTAAAAAQVSGVQEPSSAALFEPKSHVSHSTAEMRRVAVFAILAVAALVYADEEAGGKRRRRKRPGGAAGGAPGKAAALAAKRRAGGAPTPPQAARGGKGGKRAGRPDPEAMIGLLKAYKEANGHVNVPLDHTAELEGREKPVRLGRWLAAVRKNAAKVKPERVAALDAVDPKWRGD